MDTHAHKHKESLARQNMITHIRSHKQTHTWMSDHCGWRKNNTQWNRMCCRCSVVFISFVEQVKQRENTHTYETMERVYVVFFSFFFVIFIIRLRSPLMCFVWVCYVLRSCLFYSCIKFICFLEFLSKSCSCARVDSILSSRCADDSYCCCYFIH